MAPPNGRHTFCPTRRLLLKNHVIFPTRVHSPRPCHPTWVPSKCLVVPSFTKPTLPFRSTYWQAHLHVASYEPCTRIGSTLHGSPIHPIALLFSERACRIALPEPFNQPTCFHMANRRSRGAQPGSPSVHTLSARFTFTCSACSAGTSTLSNRRMIAQNVMPVHHNSSSYLYAHPHVRWAFIQPSFHVCLSACSRFITIGPPSYRVASRPLVDSPIDPVLVDSYLIHVLLVTPLHWQ